MDRKLFVFVVVVLLALMLITGCASPPETSLSFQFFQFQNSGGGNNMQTYYRNQKELELGINSGRYNVVSVKTLYDSSRLVSAELVYNVSAGEGNRVRILFPSSRYPWDQKEKGVRARLESRGFEILKIQSIHVDGASVAEVYYRIP